jgi:sortase A
MMPEREPMLFLHTRSRAMRRWGTAAIALGAVALLGSLPAGDGVFVRAKSSVTNLVRQSTWDRALAGEPAQTPWPWEIVGPAASSTVPRLGLSAAILREGDGRIEPLRLAPASALPRTAAAADAHDPHLQLGEVAVGDQITVTTADGLDRVYKVTGRHIIDSAGTETDANPADAAQKGATCWPLDPVVAGALRLVIEAVQADQKAPPAPSSEQKL